MSESIEAPKKRTYTRKPKSVTPLTTGVLGVSPNDEIPPVDAVVSDSDSSTSSTLSLTPPEKLQKPKRTYKKKVKLIEPVEVPVETIAPPPTSVMPLTAPQNYVTTRLGGEPQVEVPETVEEPVKVTPPSYGAEPIKRERTDKQKAAFEKMRLARVAKQAELNKLKDLEKQEKLLDKEKNKLDSITEKVVEKATAIKQRKSRKSQPEVLPEPQIMGYAPYDNGVVPIIQETKYRNIVFA